MKEAINNKALKISFENKGGYNGSNTELVIVNNGKYAIEIKNEIGTIIKSEDSTSQNLILIEEITATINPKQQLTRRIATYCVSPAKAGPHAQEKYFYAQEAEKYMVSLISFINKNKASIPENQSAVWAYVNASKTVYINESTNPKSLALKKQIETLYAIRLKEGLIAEDKNTYFSNSRSFVVEGIFDLFVKEAGNYTAELVDSLENKIVLFQNKPLDIGMSPIRYLHHYGNEREKAFHLIVYKDGIQLLKSLINTNSNTKNYVRYRVQNKTVLNIKNEFYGDLDIADSAGNIYLSYMKNQKMYPGIRAFDYSFTMIKPQKTTLYLQLKNANGAIVTRQKISDDRNILPLQGYAYVKLSRRAEGIFGLFDNKNKLIEEFKSGSFIKGLQMLPYGFMFDKQSKEPVFLKLIDQKTSEILYQEQVFVK